MPASFKGLGTVLCRNGVNDWIGCLLMRLGACARRRFAAVSICLSVVRLPGFTQFATAFPLWTFRRHTLAATVCPSQSSARREVGKACGLRSAVRCLSECHRPGCANGLIGRPRGSGQHFAEAQAKSRRGRRQIGRDRSKLEHLAGIGIGSERVVESQQFQPHCPGPLFGEQRAKSFTF